MYVDINVCSYICVATKLGHKLSSRSGLVGKRWWKGICLPVFYILFSCTCVHTHPVYICLYLFYYTLAGLHIDIEDVLNDVISGFV